LDNLRRTDANPLDYLARGKESLVPNQPRLHNIQEV
jgi:hypothetical protein